MWLVQPDRSTYADAELWLAAGDGSAPRLVGVDSIAGPPAEPRFTAGGQLDLFIDGDLVWLDTHDDPIRTHTIAEEVFGPAIDRGRWLIMGYEASVQDGTARLGIVDRDTGDDAPHLTRRRDVHVARHRERPQQRYPAQRGRGRTDPDRLPGARAQPVVAGRPVGRDHQPERHPLTG